MQDAAGHIGRNIKRDNLVLMCLVSVFTFEFGLGKCFANKMIIWDSLDFEYSVRAYGTREHNECTR